MPPQRKTLSISIWQASHYHDIIKGLNMTKQNGFNGIVRKLHLSFVSRFSPVGPCIRRSLLQKPPPSTSLQNSNVKWYTESKTKEKPTPTQTSIEPLLYKPPLLNIYSGVAAAREGGERGIFCHVVSNADACKPYAKNEVSSILFPGGRRGA
jgi:hypothetical protein